MKILLAPIILFVTALTVGCSDSSVAPQPDPSIPPKVGSTFTYRESLFDSTWREVTGSERTVVVEVIASDVTYRTKANVTIFREDSSRFYLSYDTDGDIYFCGEGQTETWERWPVGSGSMVEDSVPTVALPNGDSLYTARWTTRNESEVTRTPVGDFAARILSTTSMTFRAGVEMERYVETRRWYVPVLGVPARTRTREWGTVAEPVYYKNKVLVGYSLK
jgi:hypothetical protein